MNCKDCECSAVFRIPEKLHQRLRNYTKDGYEHGGTFGFDIKKQEIVQWKETNGQYSSIKVPRGIIDWHSHPDKCSDGRCAIGIPSPNDIGNIISGCVYGTFCHLVYSKEGTYGVKLDNNTLSYLKKDKNKIVEYVFNVKQKLEQLHNQMKNKPYDDYIKKWLKLTNELGLLTRLFKNDTKPVFPIKFDCSLVKKENIYQSIIVPIVYNNL